MTQVAERIEAATVERDENGYWTHPAWPPFDEEYIPRSWFIDRGLEVATVDFHDEVPEHVSDAYFDDCDCNCSGWEPSRPDGEGWFIFSIHEYEDGPVCVWVRQVQS